MARDREGWMKTRNRKPGQHPQKTAGTDSRKASNDFSEAMHRALKGKIGER